jgi:hypothetical protein
MSLILDGTNGLSDVDGSAATPAIRGSDANTGVFFGADIIGFSEGGTECARFNADAQFVAAAGTASLPVITTTGDVNTGIFFPAADTIAFAEGGAEAMRIDSAGNVGIGTSSPSVAAGRGIAINGGASHARIAFKNNATGDAANDGLQIGIDASGIAFIEQTENLPLRFATNDTERMRIDTSGGLILAGSTAQKATGTTWSNPSDERLKDNIRDYTKGTAELMQVRVREWEYNGKGGTVEGTKGLGVVADEVMVVLPDTVENYEAKLNADDEEVTAIKKFDATEITWLLVKTVQELKGINDAQAQIITALTARVEALEGAQ